MIKSHERLKTMILIALFAAIIGIMAQMTIPLPIIPITGQTLAIGLAATILGSRNGTLAVILYVLLGVIGLPVFANFQAGPAVLFGPTGGYIIGFIPTAFITGYILEKTSFRIPHALLANLVGMVITLFFGACWYKFISEIGWVKTIYLTVTPFIIPGIIKALLASLIGIIIRERLIQAKLMTNPHTN